MATDQLALAMAYQDSDAPDRAWMPSAPASHSTLREPHSARMSAAGLLVIDKPRRSLEIVDWFTFSASAIRAIVHSTRVETARWAVS
jgi:hypothetical protein